MSSEPRRSRAASAALTLLTAALATRPCDARVEYVIRRDGSVLVTSARVLSVARVVDRPARRGSRGHGSQPPLG